MRIVDLSLPINRHMKGIPNIREYDENPTRCVVLSALSDDHLAKIKAQGLETAENLEIAHHSISRFEMLGHIGTHIDAPIHFVENGQTIDQVSMEKIVKKGRVIPLTHKEPNSAVTADDVLKTGVDFDDSVIPILHTGWTDRAWGTDDFWGKMIYLDVSVGELMVERGVSAVAIDCFPEFPFWNATPEPHQANGPNHVTMLGNGTIIIQMLTNIAAIDSDDFTLAGVPLRLEGLDGSPARVFAMIE